MKTEELDKLKTNLVKLGFEYIVTDTNKDQVVMIIQSKDPWEGIEFCECVNDKLLTGAIQFEKIYPVKIIKMGCIGSTLFSGLISQTNFKPSTEQTYFEQLKKEAFERFGEIKKGDMFLLDKGNQGEFKINKLKEFDYDKGTDRLFIGGYFIYQQGKWATKIESFKATYIDWNYADNGMEVNLTFKMNNWNKAEDKDDIGEYLAEQLNKYLNEKEKNILHTLH